MGDEGVEYLNIEMMQFMNIVIHYHQSSVMICLWTGLRAESAQSYSDSILMMLERYDVRYDVVQK